MTKQQESLDKASGRQIAALMAAKATLWKKLDLSSLMQAAIEAAVASTGLDSGAIYLLENNVLYLGATTPALPADFPDALRFAHAPDHPHIMRAIDTETPVNIPNLSDEPLTAAEQEVIRARNLCTILYVPLFAGDRPVGVFMVSSTGVTKAIGDREVSVSQALAHSIALAVDEAHLFDTLMSHAGTAEQGVRERLTQIARNATHAERAGVEDLASTVRDRIRQRLMLLEIRDEILAAEAGTVVAQAEGFSVGMGALYSPQGELEDVLEASRAFAHDAADGHELDLGLGVALEYLARRSAVGPKPSQVVVDGDAQMTDADTTLLLYRAAKDLLESAARQHGLVATRIRVCLDHESHVVLILEVAREDGGALVEADWDAIRGELDPLRDRLRRAGGDLILTSADGGVGRARVELPHFGSAL